MTHQQRADRVAELIEEKLGIRGKSLERKLRRAGRILPRSFHRDGTTMVDALRLQASPRLSRMIDDSEVQRAFSACEKYLSAIDPWDRRKGKLVGFFAGNAVNLIAVSAAVMAVLIWRGYL